MKNRLFKIVILLILASGYANAQDTAFGLKGGLNLTNLKVSDPQASYDSRAGYHAGIFVRGKVGKVAFQPELLLYTSSNKVNYYGSSLNSGSVENSFTYLTVPVMIKFYIVSGLNIQVGPQFGFLLDGEQKYNTTLFKGTKDIKDTYKSTDTAISAGGGWDFPFGLNLDVRYNIGVKDINNVSNGEPAKSRVFLVSVGWNFVK
jgi:hypothetical protein